MLRCRRNRDFDQERAGGGEPRVPVSTRDGGSFKVPAGRGGRIEALDPEVVRDGDRLSPVSHAHRADLSRTWRIFRGPRRRLLPWWEHGNVGACGSSPCARFGNSGRRTREAEAALRAWHAEAEPADWAGPAKVTAQYRGASVLKSGRVVFNIAGNKFRLVVRINFPYRVIYVRFAGTHAEYDAIDADTVRRVRALGGASMNVHATASVTVRPVRTEADYEAALREIDALMDAAPDTPEGDRLDVLVALVQAYEARRHPVAPPDPVDAIRFRMEQGGLRPRDLEPYIGSRARVSEVLNRRRALTLPMIRRLTDGLGIAAAVLVREAPPAASTKRPKQSARAAGGKADRLRQPSGRKTTPGKASRRTAKASSPTRSTSARSAKGDKR